jgi:hypothetical protein
MSTASKVLPLRIFDMFCSLTTTLVAGGFWKRIQHKYVNDPSVEGVYETQLPLLFKLLMEMGCVCKFTPTAESKDKSKGKSKSGPANGPYTLNQFQFKSTAECAYLTAVPLHRIFLYHSFTEKR